MRQAISVATDTHSTRPNQPSDSCDRFHVIDQILPTARLTGETIRFKSLNTFGAGQEPAVAPEPSETWQDQLIVYRVGIDDPVELSAIAMARGAAGILTEQMLPAAIPQCIVPDVDHAAARIEHTLAGKPDQKMLTVGVVGRAGKTTTSLLISAVLRGAGIRTAYETDLGGCDGVTQTTNDLPRPVDRDFVSRMSEAVDAASQAMVIELHADALRQGNYDTAEFDLLVFTGRDESSQDYGPSWIDCAINLLAKTGVVIADADDKQTTRFLRDAGVRLVTYGLRSPADLTARLIDQSGGMSTIMVSHENVTTAMESSLCGSAMAGNLLAAMAIGILIDQPMCKTIASLGQIRLVPGRQQAIHRTDAADVIVDVARSQAQCTAALRAARSRKGAGRLWCVVATSDHQDEDLLATLGHLTERFADRTVITSATGEKDRFLSRTHQILDGVQKCELFRLVADQKRAIDWTVGEAKTNDTILLLTGNLGATPKRQRTQINQLVRFVEQLATPEKRRPAFRIVRE